MRTDPRLANSKKLSSKSSKKGILRDYLELNGLTIELNANLCLFFLLYGLFTQCGLHAALSNLKGQHQCNSLQAIDISYMMFI